MHIIKKIGELLKVPNFETKVITNKSSMFFDSPHEFNCKIKQKFNLGDYAFGPNF